MPKDGESSSHGKAPLKRGDACLYCRKRRIKCSAEKPSCSQCHGKRECEYDNGKPVSRVRQLEDKVAQLEGMLQQTSNRRPSSSDSPNGEPSRTGGVSHSNSSGNTFSLSTPGSSDVNMQQAPVPASNSGFAFEGTGMDDMNMFDINAIQQSFNEAASGLSNDFFSFGGSMFGDIGTQNLPTLGNPQRDATTMFDFSTLDPNFMSLVNSFDSTFQNNPAPPPVDNQSEPSQPQPQFQPQHSSFAATVTDDTSTGFTPYINNNYSPPSDSQPSTSTGYPLSGNDMTEPTPGRHFDNLSEMISNSARSQPGAVAPVIGEPTWNTASGSNDTKYFDANPEHSSLNGAEVRVSEVLGDKRPENPSAYAFQSATSYSTTFQKPADSSAGLGPALDQEGYELVGGWFDANDLPRVARDHL
jgi:hypothetical protein